MATLYTATPWPVDVVGCLIDENRGQAKLEIRNGGTVKVSHVSAISMWAFVGTRLGPVEPAADPPYPTKSCI